jgi:hypothetical protein
MPKPCRVPHQGQMLTLRELAAATGINPATIFKRWSIGDRGEKLIRPLDPRGARNPLARKDKPTCQINSLLVGWKLAPSASEAKTVSTPFAKSVSPKGTGTNYGI